MTTNFASRLRDEQTGAAAVELGLVAIMLAGIITPLVDLGMGTYDKMRVQDAAAAAAQYALVNGYDASAMQSAGQNATSLSSAVNVTVSPEACYCVNSSNQAASATCGSSCSDGSTAGTYVQVSTSYTYTPILRPSSPMTLTGSAFVRVQ